MLKQVMSTSHKDFCRAVDKLCNAYADLVLIKNKVSNAEVVDDEEIVTVKECLDKINQNISEVKGLEEELGYEEVGIPFLENSNYDGFSLIDGELVGDLENAYLIACPWFISFAEGEDLSIEGAYKFFIGSYIMFFADKLTNYYLEQAVLSYITKTPYKTAIVAHSTLPVEKIDFTPEVKPKKRHLLLTLLGGKNEKGA